MKNIEFSPRLLLSAMILMLGVIIAAVPKNTTTPFKLTAEQILEELKSNTQYIEPDAVAQMIIEKDPTLRLIDVRPKDEFEKFSLPGAINIPIDNILSPEFTEIFNQNVMLNVLYANGSTRANEAWMLLRQLGYQNNFVLQGGLNYWAENIMNPGKPPSTAPDDELARYDFRRAASQALSGGQLQLQETELPVRAAPPRPAAQGQRKAIKGGCS